MYRKILKWANIAILGVGLLVFLLLCLLTIHDPAPKVALDAAKAGLVCLAVWLRLVRWRRQAQQPPVATEGGAENDRANQRWWALGVVGGVLVLVGVLVVLGVQPDGTVAACRDATLSPAVRTQACNAVIGRFDTRWEGDALKNLAYMQLSMGDTITARRNFNRLFGAVHMKGRHGGETSMDPAAYLGRCFVELDEGRPDRALADCGQSLKLVPGQPQAIAAEGFAFILAGQMDSALRTFDGALAQSPHLPLAHSGRGTVMVGRGDYASALAEFDEAVLADPTDWKILNARCQTLALMGRARDALADCDRALTLYGNQAIVLKTRGYAHLRAGDQSAALEDFQTALQIRPKWAVALYGRSLAEAGQGMADQAAADRSSALALKPGIAAAFPEFSLPL